MPYYELKIAGRTFREGADFNFSSPINTSADNTYGRLVSINLINEQDREFFQQYNGPVEAQLLLVEDEDLSLIHI